MKYIQLKDVFLSELTSIYSKEEINSIFFIAIEHFCKITKTELLLYYEKSIPENNLSQLIHTLSLLKKQMPIQYILKECHFYGSIFYVTPHTLIPRQETEELVNWIISEVDKNDSLKILDIGTGTGCIAISLAKSLKKASIYAVDISQEALNVAQKNIERNQVSNVHLNKMDILNTSQLDPFDIIVSNPPYIRYCEKKEMKPNVLNFEPHSALFVDDNDPFIFYKKISNLAYHSLCNKGKLYFEINEYLSVETQNVIKTSGFKLIEIKNDIQQKPRMIMAKK